MSLSSDGAVMTMPVTPAYQGGNGGFGGWGGDRRPAGAVLLRYSAEH